MITSNVSIVRATIFISGLNNKKLKVKKLLPDINIKALHVYQSTHAMCAGMQDYCLVLSYFCLVDKMNISNTNLAKHPGLFLIEIMCNTSNRIKTFKGIVLHNSISILYL